MEQPLYKYLEKKFTLHAEKNRTISRIKEKKAYFGLFKDFHMLQLIITKEILLNKKILQKIKQLNLKLSRIGIEPLFETVEYSTRALIRVLNEEARAIGDVTIVDLFFHNVSFIVKKDSKFYFNTAFDELTKKYEEENKLNSRYLTIVEKEEKRLSQLIDHFATKKQSFFGEKRLFEEAQRDYRELIKAIGNEYYVNKKAKEILRLIAKIKETKIYEFIKKDVAAFEKKVRYIMEHPKDNKAAYLLASAYIISPGTFEATFIVLLFRYLGKYVKEKRRRF